MKSQRQAQILEIISTRDIETQEQLLEELQNRGEELLPKGCTVLLKASHGMKFSEVLDYLREAGN